MNDIKKSYTRFDVVYFFECDTAKLYYNFISSYFLFSFYSATQKNLCEKSACYCFLWNGLLVYSWMALAL